MPLDKVEKLLDVEASNQADIDEFHEEREETAAQRIEDLLNFPEERDPEIFELIGASVEDAFIDHFAIPYLERDPLWTASLSALAVAARIQAWIEIYGVEFITLAQKNGQGIDNLRKKMQPSELKEAALKGIGKARINGEKERRKMNRETVPR